MSIQSSAAFSAGYLLALGPLIFVSVFDVWLERFTIKQAYVMNLLSVGVVAFGCTGNLILRQIFKRHKSDSFVDF